MLPDSAVEEMTLSSEVSVSTLQTRQALTLPIRRAFSSFAATVCALVISSSPFRRQNIFRKPRTSNIRCFRPFFKAWRPPPGHDLKNRGVRGQIAVVLAADVANGLFIAIGSSSAVLTGIAPHFSQTRPSKVAFGGNGVGAAAFIFALVGCFVGYPLCHVGVIFRSSCPKRPPQVSQTDFSVQVAGGFRAVFGFTLFTAVVFAAANVAAVLKGEPIAEVMTVLCGGHNISAFTHVVGGAVSVGGGAVGNFFCR